MNIFHTELHVRSHAFFGWWTPPEPLRADRTRRAGAPRPRVDAAER